MLSGKDRKSLFDADECAVHWNGRVYREVVAFNAVPILVHRSWPVQSESVHCAYVGQVMLL